MQCLASHDVDVTAHIIICISLQGYALGPSRAYRKYFNYTPAELFNEDMSSSSSILERKTVSNSVPEVGNCT
jgi:hypothetical protein